MMFILLFIFLFLLLSAFFLYCLLIPSTDYDQAAEDQEQMQYLTEYRHKRQGN